MQGDYTHYAQELVQEAVHLIMCVPRSHLDVSLLVHRPPRAMEGILLLATVDRFHSNGFYVYFPIYIHTVYIHRPFGAVSSPLFRLRNVWLSRYMVKD